MPRKSQCPFCPKRYLYSTAYRNHIERSHPGRQVDIVREPEANTTHELNDSSHSLIDGIDLSNHAPNDEVDPADSDFESNSSSTEQYLGGRLSEPSTYEGAGAILYNAAHLPVAEDNSFGPFSTEFDFRLARWFIESRTPKEHVQKFFQEGLVPPDCTIKSAYTLFQKVDQMGFGMGTSSWKTGTVDFGFHSADNADFSLPEDEATLPQSRKQERFYYRDPVECARFLLGQPCFAKNTVFAPVREWNGDTPRRTVYSEMHTAEWWWETQVSPQIIRNLLNIFANIMIPCGPLGSAARRCYIGAYHLLFRCHPPYEFLWGQKGMANLYEYWEYTLRCAE